MTPDKGRAAGDALVLGTAQFGSPYGIANRHGKPDRGQIGAILDAAYEGGLRLLDTAAAYGDSEAVLGAVGMDRWTVITKIPSLADTPDRQVGARARASVMRSIDRLGVRRLHAVLAHDRRDMLGERGCRVLDALAPLRDHGLIGQIGVSVYAPSDLVGLVPAATRLVQAPFNVLDQRFKAPEVAAWLRDAGGALHLRSPFLQGLLLIPGARRPARFARWAPILDRFDARVRASGLSAVAFCLGFATTRQDAARIVVGVETASQLAALLSAFAAGQRALIDANDLAVSDAALIDPRRWKDAA